MRKLSGLLVGLSLVTSLFSQPDQWYVAIDPAEVSTLLGPNRRKSVMLRVDGADIPVIDGMKDAVWDKVSACTYDRYINYHTDLTAGVYSHKSDLSDGSNTRRLPDNASDFSGTYRVIYDDDFMYYFFDITDNEVNDNYVNPGIAESFEIQIAPYPDSAKQMLQSSPYPPYTGPAGVINKKFCYWAYLGALHFWFDINHGGNCLGHAGGIRQKPDAVKINWYQRFQSCGCAWDLKGDGTGYTAEIAISLKVALADSANNPFTVPATVNDTQWISLETKVLDEDLGMKTIQASWNAQDNNVWDAMVFSGKTLMRGSGTSC
jgi:hypothetical protein